MTRRPSEQHQGRQPMVVRAGEAAARSDLAAGGEELIGVLDPAAVVDELANLVDLTVLIEGPADYEHQRVVVVERGEL